MEPFKNQFFSLCPRVPIVNAVCPLCDKRPLHKRASPLREWSTQLAHCARPDAPQLRAEINPSDATLVMVMNFFFFFKEEEKRERRRRDYCRRPHAPLNKQIANTTPPHKRRRVGSFVLFTVAIINGGVRTVSAGGAKINTKAILKQSRIVTLV